MFFLSASVKMDRLLLYVSALLNLKSQKEVYDVPFLPLYKIYPQIVPCSMAYFVRITGYRVNVLSLLSC
jgi:hypothetical protein